MRDGGGGSQSAFRRIRSEAAHVSREEKTETVRGGGRRIRSEPGVLGDGQLREVLLRSRLAPRRAAQRWQLPGGVAAADRRNAEPADRPLTWRRGEHER